MSAPEPSDEPDLDALAARLEKGTRRLDEPIAPYDVTVGGRGALLVGAGVLTVLLAAVAWTLGAAPLERLWWLLLPCAVLAVLAWAIRPGHAFAHVDDTGITVAARLRSRRGHHPWSSLSEVGWLPSDGMFGTVLVLRPRRQEPGGPGPTDPLQLLMPVQGDAARARVRDVLAHGCRRHGVTYSEDRAALGTAPPGSPFR